MDDCRHTLDKIDAMISDVQKYTLFGRWKATKAIRLNLKMKEITLYRQQAQSFNGAMQSALQMMNLSFDSQSIISRHYPAQSMGIRESNRSPRIWSLAPPERQ
jgi:hypothetical protein